MADILRASALKPLVARYALQHKVPYELADAVIRIESRYNAGARNGPNLGLTQLNFRTAQSLGYTGEASGLFDAETNLRFGLKYLAQAYQSGRGRPLRRRASVSRRASGRDDDQCLTGVLRQSEDDNR